MDKRMLPAALALMVASVIAFHLLAAIGGHPLYRDIHMGAAIDYARHGMDFLRPRIIGFTLNEAPMPQEIPIWQALAGLALRLSGEKWAAASLVSLLLFFSALYPLHRLGRRIADAPTALWALSLFSLQPIAVMLSGQASPDGAAIALAIWFVFCALEWIEARRLRWWLLTALVGAAAATMKLPFFFAAGLAIFFIVLKDHRRDLRAWAGLGAVAALIALTFLAWQTWCNHCYAQAQYPFWELRMSENPAMRRWYFGDWSYRLDPAHWIKGGWRALNALWGSFALAALAGVALFARRISLAHLWLAGAFLTNLIFSKLVLQHSHYYIMYSPAIALLGACTLRRIFESGWLEEAWKKAALHLVIFAALAASTLQGLIGLEVVQYFDPYHKKMAAVIRSHVPEDEKILILGGGWGGNLLILSDRQGLSFNPDHLRDPRFLPELRRAGYRRMIAFSESPLRHALQKTNPGSADLQRGTWKSALENPEAFTLIQSTPDWALFEMIDEPAIEPATPPDPPAPWTPGAASR